MLRLDDNQTHVSPVVIALLLRQVVKTLPTSQPSLQHCFRPVPHTLPLWARQEASQLLSLQPPVNDCKTEQFRLITLFESEQPHPLHQCGRSQSTLQQIFVKVPQTFPYVAPHAWSHALSEVPTHWFESS